MSLAIVLKFRKSQIKRYCKCISSHRNITFLLGDFKLKIFVTMSIQVFKILMIQFINEKLYMEHADINCSTSY